MTRGKQLQPDVLRLRRRGGLRLGIVCVTVKEKIFKVDSTQLKMHFYVTIRQVARKYNHQLDDKQLSIVGIAVSNRLKDHRPHQKVTEGNYRVNCFAIHNERLILEELGKYSELLTQRCDET